MNYLLNKNNKLNKKGFNSRYFIKSDKKEGQINYDNIFNKKNNLIKNNNIYNSNFFDVNNKIKNINHMIQNFNKKKEKKEEIIRSSNSTDNKFLYITNFKNMNQKQLSCKKQNDKEEKKNIINNDNSNKESIPYILQIQKLIKCFKNQNNNKIHHNNANANKEKNKLPNLINKVKPRCNEIKPLIIRHQNIGITDECPITVYSINDIYTSKVKKRINLQDNDNNKSINSINSYINKNNSNTNLKKKNSTTKIRMTKVSVNNVMNLIKQTLIVNNNGSDEKIVNIRLKLNEKMTKNKFYSCNNTIDVKSKKENYNFCVSNYNNFKSDLMCLKQTFHNMENERNKKENLVNKNKTMFKNPFFEKKYIEESEDYEEKENDPKRFSKYYLPSSGFGLLSRYNNS